MKPLLSLMLLLLTSLSAYAVEYTRIDPARSTLLLAFTQMGVTVEGSFRKFEARLLFDPAHPEKARAELIIPLSSLDTGSPEADEEAQRPAWLDSKSQPDGRFQLKQLERLGEGRFRLHGTLSLKGRAQPLISDATLTEHAAHAVLTGSLPLSRTAFDIGSGEWADTTLVADRVDIRYRFTLLPPH